MNAGLNTRKEPVRHGLQTAANPAGGTRCLSVTASCSSSGANLLRKVPESFSSKLAFSSNLSVQSSLSPAQLVCLSARGSPQA